MKKFGVLSSQSLTQNQSSLPSLIIYGGDQRRQIINNHSHFELWMKTAECVDNATGLRNAMDVS